MTLCCLCINMYIADIKIYVSILNTMHYEGWKTEIILTVNSIYYTETKESETVIVFMF